MTNLNENINRGSVNPTDRDAELKRLAHNVEYFGSKDIELKTELSGDQRRDLSIVKGYSELVGGLPGIDEAIQNFYLLGVSVDRRGRVEWVESNKPGNTILSPASYPLPSNMESTNKPGLMSKILNRK